MGMVWREPTGSDARDRSVDRAGIDFRRSVSTLRRYGPGNLLRGLLVRRHFDSKQFIVCLPGWPFPRIRSKGRLEASVCVLSPGVRIDVARGATLVIGKGAYLNQGVRIVCHDRIEIGAGCRIAYDAIIADSDEHMTQSGRPMMAPVVLGEGCWIGSRAIILKGVTIGDRAVIGAGAVVTRDVPPYAVAVGQPARVIRIEAPEHDRRNPPIFR
jgi:acetyltransferase-like isoleucine patch superfamily enzyme